MRSGAPANLVDNLMGHSHPAEQVHMPLVVGRMRGTWVVVQAGRERLAT